MIPIPFQILIYSFNFYIWPLSSWEYIHGDTESLFKRRPSQQQKVQQLRITQINRSATFIGMYDVQAKKMLYFKMTPLRPRWILKYSLQRTEKVCTITQASKDVQPEKNVDSGSTITGREGFNVDFFWRGWKQWLTKWNITTSSPHGWAQRLDWSMNIEWIKSTTCCCCDSIMRWLHLTSEWSSFRIIYQYEKMLSTNNYFCLCFQYLSCHQHRYAGFIISTIVLQCGTI